MDARCKTNDFKSDQCSIWLNTLEPACMKAKKYVDIIARNTWTPVNENSSIVSAKIKYIILAIIGPNPPNIAPRCKYDFKYLFIYIPNLSFTFF